MYTPSFRFSHRLIDKNNNKNKRNKPSKLPFPLPPQFPPPTSKSQGNDEDDDDSGISHLEISNDPPEAIDEYENLEETETLQMNEFETL